jgi:hypothetical protein
MWFAQNAGNLIEVSGPEHAQRCLPESGYSAALHCWQQAGCTTCSTIAEFISWKHPQAGHGPTLGTIPLPLSYSQSTYRCRNPGSLPCCRRHVVCALLQLTLLMPKGPGHIPYLPAWHSGYPAAMHLLTAGCTTGSKMAECISWSTYRLGHSPTLGTNPLLSVTPSPLTVVETLEVSLAAGSNTCSSSRHEAAARMC